MQATVESLAFGGDGIVRTTDGMVVFVPFTAPGDKISFEISSQHKKFARGTLLEVIEPSSDRIEPRCPYYGRCGGCQLQHLSYPAQVKAKERFITDALQRIAGRRRSPCNLQTPPTPTADTFASTCAMASPTSTPPTTRPSSALPTAPIFSDEPPP